MELIMRILKRLCFLAPNDSKTDPHSDPPSTASACRPTSVASSAASAIADSTHDNSGPGFQIFVPPQRTSCKVDAVLCRFCRNLVDRLLLPRTSRTVATTGSNILHHTTLKAFTASGGRCHLCNLIARELPAFPGGEPYGDHLITIYFDTDDTACGFSVELLRQGQAMTLPFRLRLTSTTANGHENYQLGKVLVADDGVVPVPDNYPSTEENLKLIRGWIDACTHHTICQETRLDSPLPRRVLDISRADNVVTLYEPDTTAAGGERAPYATLSYCWGDGLSLRTLTDNLDRHKKGIPLAAFPTTMRDIIPLVRDLGFRYIWIDALCIIQDNAADWQEQATAMTAIYQGCSLNIAVSDSPSCDAGATRTLQRSSVRLGTASSSSSSSPPFTTQSPSSNAAEILVVCEPKPNTSDSALLSTRGWVFQETLVSIATVFVCHRGLEWECCSRSCRQGAKEDLQLPIGGGGMAKFETAKGSWASNVHRLAQISNSSAQWRPNPRRPISPLWVLYLWVSHVSGRHLTVPNDKLPVFSGLVSRIAAATGATYVAGLWKEDIILGLTWHVSRGSRSERHKDRAPSWSWASVDGVVEWLWCVSVNAKHPALVGLKADDLEVLGVAVDEVFPGSFGEVRGGRITAIGTLYDEAQLAQQLYCFWDEEQKVVKGVVEPKRYFLRIAYIEANRASIGKAKGAFWHTFLIIESTDGKEENEFHRVGYAHDKDTWSVNYGSGERKRITLV